QPERGEIRRPPASPQGGQPQQVGGLYPRERERRQRQDQEQVGGADHQRRRDRGAERLAAQEGEVDQEQQRHPGRGGHAGRAGERGGDPDVVDRQLAADQHQQRRGEHARRGGA